MRSLRRAYSGAKLVSLVMFVATVARGADVTLDKTTLTLDAGGAAQLHVQGGQSDQSGAGLRERWTSSDPTVAQVYQNGFVIALHPGSAMVGVGPAARCAVTVTPPHEPIVDPKTLKQFPDSRLFRVGERKCYGSELNGQRNSEPQERQFTAANRVINPQPLNGKETLEWEVQNGTEIYDGAGVFMGTVAELTETAGRGKVHSSKFNFGMSKVLGGKMCVYAFSVTIKPTPDVARLAHGELNKDGTVDTSAWLPLDRVVNKETLIERVGLGKVKLPRLPLDAKGYRITGGDPTAYMTEFGELRIVKDPNANPVPSHYLRRPSGTVNIIYSVPGFGLGGQGLDSFLISDGILFRPAVGAKVFVQPTYYPAEHPKAGKASNKTMTFIYGAAEVKGVEPVYGWVAREALAARF